MMRSDHGAAGAPEPPVFRTRRPARRGNTSTAQLFRAPVHGVGAGRCWIACTWR